MINIDYNMAFFISDPLSSALGHDFGHGLIRGLIWKMTCYRYRKMWCECNMFFLSYTSTEDIQTKTIFKTLKKCVCCYICLAFFNNIFSWFLILLLLSDDISTSFGKFQKIYLTGTFLCVKHNKLFLYPTKKVLRIRKYIIKKCKRNITTHAFLQSFKNSFCLYVFCWSIW